MDKNILSVLSSRQHKMEKWNYNKKNMVQIWQDKEAIFYFSSFQRAGELEDLLAWLEDKIHSFYGLKTITIQYKIRITSVCCKVSSEPQWRNLASFVKLSEWYDTSLLFTRQKVIPLPHLKLAQDLKDKYGTVFVVLKNIITENIRAGFIRSG